MDNITGLLADACPHGPDCPRIHDTDGDTVIVQGDKVTDPAQLEKLHLPTHEGAVAVPRTLIYPEAMTLDGLSDWLATNHTRHLLRIENRTAYASASDGGDFARYLAGEPDPIEGGAWHDRLRADTTAGRTWSKVHIVNGPDLSDYERYEFEWGFTRTAAAGERVRILDAQPGEFAGVPDFFVLDHQHVARSIYSDTGRFVGAMLVTGPDAAVYRVLAQTVWERATDFTTWWDAHPEAHRRPNAA